MFSLVEGLLVRPMVGLAVMAQPVADMVVVTAVEEEAHKPLEPAVPVVMVDFLAEVAAQAQVVQMSAVLQELEAVVKSEFIHGR